MSYWFLHPRFSRTAPLAACAALLLSASAMGETQKELFNVNNATNNKGSDQSMQVSTTYAMSALMDLASLKIPSAVNNGMTAYGKYRNSETMDKISAQSAQRAASMGSVGSGEASGVTQSSQTSFRRLNPGFLREGAAAQVANEFEKRTGMSRETFLNELSNVSEKKISRNDPQLVDKVIGRFESFISKIPNQEFRGNLQKAVDMVPATVRTGLVGKAVSKFANMMTADASISAPDNKLSAADAAALAAANSAGKEESPAAAAVAEAEESRAPASEAVPALGTSLSEQKSVAAGGEDANRLGSIVQAALTSQDASVPQDMTIFQQVSRVYRGMAGFFNDRPVGRR
jgi:hypothetical protein